MSTLGDRLKTLRGSESQAAFARRLGLPQTTWSNYESNKSELNFALIDTLTTNFKVNTDWLLFGRGPMHRGEEAHPSDIVMNFELLHEVVASLEHALNVVKRELQPDDKAEAVCLLYQYFSSSEDDAEKPAAVLKVLYGGKAANE